jgi:ankyrin repeat protein
MGSLRSIQGEANRLRSKERRDAEQEIALKRKRDFMLELHGAVLRNDFAKTSSLLEENSDLIATTDLAWTFNKALTVAIHLGHRETVSLLLRFADVNHIEENTGKTPIIYAVIDGDLETVKSLLDAGADPNLKRGRQKTALFHARKRKYDHIVGLLIAAGATE